MTAKKLKIDANLDDETVNVNDPDLGDEVDTGTISYDEDLSDALPPEPLPDGDYRATIVDAKEVESKSRPGTFYMKVDFLIAPDQFPADYDADNAPPDGLILSYRRLSTENTRPARYRMKKFLEAVHYPLSKRIVMSELVTLEAVLKVSSEEYDGVLRNQIDSVSSVD